MTLQKQIEILSHQKRIHGLDEKITKKELMSLKKGVPIQKIIGFINFDDLKIHVDHNVLIPRYETEEVIHKALPFIEAHSKVLDLCCGSGYIGLTIKHKTNANVTLVDISDEAILQTQENAKLNNLEVTIFQSDLFEKITSKFDVIICNPPYIPDHTQLSKAVLNFEPHEALFGGKQGNTFYKKIIQKVQLFLNKNGVVVFEISPTNSSFLSKHGFTIFQDINGKERIAIKNYS